MRAVSVFLVETWHLMSWLWLYAVSCDCLVAQLLYSVLSLHIFDTRSWTQALNLPGFHNKIARDSSTVVQLSGASRWALIPNAAQTGGGGGRGELHTVTQILSLNMIERQMVQEISDSVRLHYSVIKSRNKHKM